MTTTQLQRLPWREDECRVEFTGRLELDPEFREVEGVAVCRLLIACVRTRAGSDGPVKTTIHIQVKAAYAEARRCCQELRKGMHVTVLGELDSFEEKTADGSRRIALQVGAHEIAPAGDPSPGLG
jgi:single-stranded DNA-binding protein